MFRLAAPLLLMSAGVSARSAVHGVAPLVRNLAALLPILLSLPSDEAFRVVLDLIKAIKLLTCARIAVVYCFDHFEYCYTALPVVWLVAQCCAPMLAYSGALIRSTEPVDVVSVVCWSTMVVGAMAMRLSEATAHADWNVFRRRLAQLGRPPNVAAAQSPEESDRDLLAELHALCPVEAFGDPGNGRVGGPSSGCSREDTSTTDAVDAVDGVDVMCDAPVGVCQAREAGGAEEERAELQADVAETVEAVELANEYCGICLEALVATDPVRGLPCGHRAFHADCLERYFAVWARGPGARGALAPTCPICRALIVAQGVPQAVERWLLESEDDELLWVLSELGRRRPELMRQVANRPRPSAAPPHE